MDGLVTEPPELATDPTIEVALDVLERREEESHRAEVYLETVRPPAAPGPLTDPAYRRLQSAATVARLANEMFVVGVVLLVLERGGSTWLAGAAVAAFTLPSVVTGPFLGAWPDRRGRATLPLAADQAVGMAAARSYAYVGDSTMVAT
ncbi:MAG: hypothetical protein WKF94_08850 [Solirubrobacteraceae bacterium]